MVLFKPRLTTRHTTRYSTISFQHLPEPIQRPQVEERFHIDFYRDSDEMTTYLTGNGTVTKNDVTRRYDQSTGITVQGEASIYTSRTWKPDNTPLIYEGEYNDFIIGDGGTIRGVVFGFTSGFGPDGGGVLTGNTQKAYFYYHTAVGNWRVALTRGIFGEEVYLNISAVEAGVKMKIILTSSYVNFYVGGNLVYTTTPATVQYIPNVLMPAGCGVFNNDVATIATSNSITGSVQKGL